MSFARRTFPEVLDNLLTDITGGVAAESHPFPPPGTTAPPYRHSLQQPPASDVISVYGVRDGKPHLFQKGVDYVLLPDSQTLAWKEQQKGAQLPDEGTLLSVNYYPAAAKRTLTDLQVGSVLRTLAESAALEIGRLYAQLDVVYQSGFIDTATGAALDNVVSLLGMTRVRGGRAAGEVEFSRAPGSRGAINVPAGTRVMTADGKVQYETTESITLAPVQNTIRAVARDLQPGGILSAGALTVLPVPIAGIAGVTNPAPTAVTTQDETDRELRTRAKNFLHGSERATLGAITQALAAQGVGADIEEVADVPGRVEITMHAESMPPELQQRLLTAIEQSRPAGVQVVLKGVQPLKKVNMQLRLTTNNSLLAVDLRAVQRTVHDKLADYFARLPARQAGSVNKIVALVSSVSGVEDVRLLGVTVDGTNVMDVASGQLNIAGFSTTLGELSIADPNLPTQLNVVVTFPQAQAPADKPAIQTALAGALAYLNTLNAGELAPAASNAEQAKRVLSYGKLLLVTPLPVKPGASLAGYDNMAPGTAPALPSETSISPYQVQFVFTQAGGQSTILEKAAHNYILVPFERLSAGDVTITARSNA